MIVAVMPGDPKTTFKENVDKYRNLLSDMVKLRDELKKYEYAFECFAKDECEHRNKSTLTSIKCKHEHTKFMTQCSLLTCPLGY